MDNIIERFKSVQNTFSKLDEELYNYLKEEYNIRINNATSNDELTEIWNEINSSIPNSFAQYRIYLQIKNKRKDLK